ncbi:M14 family metallopeptidase [Agromyces sp. MMS24-K17]|uniref:M14 family metallopeptidase n=1 Tax=Agromyces sp. MMS24-K17 TaxID=3372850 RepID=UPI003754EFFD
MSRRSTRAAALAVTAAVALGGLIVAPGAAYSAEDDDVRLITLDAADAAAVADLDVVESGEHGLVVLGDASTEDLLADRGVTPLAVEPYAEAIGGEAAAAPRAARSALAATAYPVPERLAGHEYETYFGGYRTVDAYAAFAEDIAGAYPDIAQLVDFGDSWLKTQGRGGSDLLAVRLTADVADQPAPTDGQEGRPRFVLVAQAHAREVITSELAWRYATELLDGYGTDPQVTALLDSTEVWINFQNNPDGIELVEQALATSPVNASGDATPPSSSKAWQRKNANDSLFSPTSGNWSSQQAGVDLNRNWGFHWGEASTSSNPTSATYKGTAPHSEPEIAALSGLLTDLFGSFPAENAQAAPADRAGTYVNLHSYADYVIYPYAYSAPALVPNLEPIKANAFRQSYASGFATGKAGEILYDNSGNDIDWIYSQLGVPAYTYEIGTARTGGFFPAYSRVAAFWNSVAPGIRFAAEAAYEPYTAGLGGVVDEVAAARTAGGAIAVSGIASDDRYGAEPSSAARRPAVTDIVAVEAALAAGRESIGQTVPLALDGSGSTVGFSGSIPVTTANADQRAVFVRAKNGSGQWGPWQAATVDLVGTTTTVTHTGRAFTATVSPELTGPAAPTGTVQFALNGAPVGQPVALKKGAAKTAVPANLGDGVVTAVFTGDAFYAGSEGAGSTGR